MDTFASFLAEHVSEGDEPYFESNQFWPRFLNNINFDHYFLIELIKAVLSDALYRQMIIKQLIHAPFSFLYGESNVATLEEQLSTMRRKWRAASENNRHALLTWKYPAVIDSEGLANSHYTILLVDPMSKAVLSIDSRGVDYAENFHPLWSRARSKLKAIFSGCHWTEYNYYDEQGERQHDHFCQSWSLIFLEEYMNSLVSEHCPPSLSDQMTIEPLCDYSRLVDFWRRCLSIKAVRRALYDTLYNQTHCLLTHKRKYHRYFSTLEALVCRGAGKVYSSRKSLEESGVLECFLDFIASDVRLLQRIVGEIQDEPTKPPSPEAYPTEKRRKVDQNDSVNGEIIDLTIDSSVILDFSMTSTAYSSSTELSPSCSPLPHSN